MPVTIRPFGNSRGVIIPKPLLTQVGLQDEAEIFVQDGALVLRPPKVASGQERTHPAGPDSPWTRRGWSKSWAP